MSVCPHSSTWQGLLGTQLLRIEGRRTRGTQRGFPLVWEDPDLHRPGLDPRVPPRHPNAPTLCLPPPSVLTGFAPTSRVRAGDQALFSPPGVLAGPESHDAVRRNSVSSWSHVPLWPAVPGRRAGCRWGHSYLRRGPSLLTACGARGCPHPRPLLLHVSCWRQPA